jgi:hypothetical protein
MALEPMGATSEGPTKTQGHVGWSLHRSLRGRGAVWAALAGSLLVGVYAGTLAVANSFEHVLDEFLRLWFWMVPLVIGFSLQVGLFVYARGAARARHSTAHAHGVVACGGASTLSMVACCAHHLTDVLPIIGFAGAVTLLATYQDMFLLLGVLSNLVGLVYVLGLLRRHGLSPSRRSLLSLALRWPVDRALLPTVALAAAVFVAALLAGTT